MIGECGGLRRKAMHREFWYGKLTEREHNKTYAYVG